MIQYKNSTTHVVCVAVVQTVQGAAAAGVRDIQSARDVTLLVTSRQRYVMSHG